jgi:hypothetical protein
MVNRIEPVRPSTTPGVERVDDEGGRSGQEQPEGDGEEKGDAYDKLSEKTDWNILFDKSHLWQQSIDVPIEDVQELKFISVNLKTDPCLLQIRVKLKDGTSYDPAFLSMSRTAGFKLKNQPRLSHLPVGQIVRGRILTLTVPKDEGRVREEITRVTRDPRERTVSYTFKRLVSRRSLLHRLGLRDPVSQRINSEIVWIYLTIGIVVAAFVFGVYYLNR